MCVYIYIYIYNMPLKVPMSYDNSISIRDNQINK